MARSARGAVLVALLGDLAMALAKLVAALIAPSAALVAEAVHSVGAAGSQALLLLGFRLARVPGPGLAPLALARERYYWGALVAFGVFAVGGAFAVHAGVAAVHRGGAPAGDAAAAYVVLGFAALLTLVAAHGSLRQLLGVARGRPFAEVFRSSRDPTVAFVLLEDGAGLAGVIVALAGQLAARSTGRAAWDGAAAVAVGLLLALRAVLVALRARRILLGDPAARTDHEKIRRLLALQPGIERVVDVTLVHLAPEDLLLGLSVDFRPDVGFDEIRRIVHGLEYRLREALPHLKRVYIEAGSVVRFWERGTDRSPGPPR